MPVRDAVAGMTLPDEPSGGLHTALGFEPMGTSQRTGHQHGRWRDVLWRQRALGPSDDEPTLPT